VKTVPTVKFDLNPLGLCAPKPQSVADQLMLLGVVLYRTPPHVKKQTATVALNSKSQGIPLAQVANMCADTTRLHSFSEKHKLQQDSQLGVPMISTAKLVPPFSLDSGQLAVASRHVYAHTRRKRGSLSHLLGLCCGCLRSLFDMYVS